MNENQKVLLGGVLKDLRIKNDMTLKEVAAKIGKTHKSVQLYETGEVSISVEVLLDLAKVYGVAAGDILNKIK